MTFNSNHLCEYYHLFSTPFKSEGEKWHPMRQKIRVKKWRINLIRSVELGATKDQARKKFQMRKALLLRDHNSLMERICTSIFLFFFSEWTWSHQRPSNCIITLWTGPPLYPRFPSLARQLPHSMLSYMHSSIQFILTLSLVIMCMIKIGGNSRCFVNLLSQKEDLEEITKL